VDVDLVLDVDCDLDVSLVSTFDLLTTRSQHRDGSVRQR
jgi:hypothetical protein